MTSRKSLRVVIDPDLLARLADFHRAAGIPGTIQDSGRELLWAALNAPEWASAIVQATRRRAFRQVRNDVLKRFRQMQGQISREFEAGLGTFNDAELDRELAEIAER